MEQKSVAATDEKVSNTYIPDDIAFSILSKLPLKSFKRFECLRKSWSILSENHYFMNLFRNNFLSNSRRCSYDEGSSLLLFVIEHHKRALYSFSGERFENKIILDFSIPFKTHNYFRIYGSINGTLCLHQNEYDNYGRTVLCNPTTQTVRLLPSSMDELSITSHYNENCFDVSVTSRFHGFGYDHVINDYNVIRHVKVLIEPIYYQDGEINLGPLWEIYSLRSNSWRKLHVEMPSSADCTEGTQVYMDGVCHWLCEKHEDNPIGPCLVSFYLSNKVSFTTPIPSDVDDSYDVGAEWINLMVLNGSIALISYHEETTIFRVSILGQLGFKESWIKLFMVGPLPCVERPIRVGTKGEVFFIRKDKEVAWFDLSTQMIEELGYTAENLRCMIINYKENILPLEE